METVNTNKGFIDFKSLLDRHKQNLQEPLPKSRNIAEWQLLGLEIIKFTKAQGYEKGSIFKCCKMNEQRAKTAFDDCKELNKPHVKYFFKVFNSLNKPVCPKK